MQRSAEPELMDEEEQARAYAEADFSEPHGRFLSLFGEAFPDLEPAGIALDLGCGPADIAMRLVKAFPGWQVHGLDGADAMLNHGRSAVRRAGLDARIQLIKGYLPGAVPPLAAYDAVISNSLLHHLADPAVLWDSVKRWGKPGAPVFVMDLLRPPSLAEAARLVARHAAGEPEILRRDFHNSLLAAYRPEEIRAQLRKAGLAQLEVREASDRHVVVSGRLPS